MTPDFWALVPIAGMATGAFFMYGVYRLVNRWLDMRARRDAVAASEELRELQRDVDDIRALAPRITELEERLDFAERMLAQGRERGSLPSGT